MQRTLQKKESTLKKNTLHFLMHSTAYCLFKKPMIGSFRAQRNFRTYSSSLFVRGIRPYTILCFVYKVLCLSIFVLSCGRNKEIIASGDTNSDRTVDTSSGDEIDSDSNTEIEEIPMPSEWQWVFESFEKDFLEGEENRNQWTTEGAARLDILQDVFSAYSDKDNTGYLRVAAVEDDVSMIKKSDVQSGNLKEVSTDFYFYVDEILKGDSSDMSIVRFRNRNLESIGVVKLLIDGRDKFRLTLRYDKNDASDSISLDTKTWYRIIFSYSASRDEQLGLSVETVNGNVLGTAKLSSVESGVESFLYGKVDYAQSLGTLLFDDISIRVPSIKDLFVSESGNDEHDGLNTENSLRTISSALLIAGPGTTVHVLPGRYNEQLVFNYSGQNSTGAVLTLAGEGKSPDEVVIDGKEIDVDTTSSLPWGGIVFITNTKHVTLQNISITDSESSGVFIQHSSQILLENIKTYDTQMSGVYVELSEDIEISGVEVYRGCLLDSDTVAAQENISIRTVNRFSVHDCMIDEGAGNDNGGEGICVKGYCRYGKIYRNKVFDLPGDVGIYLGVGSEGDGTLRTHNILVYQNEVRADSGIAVSSEYGGTIEDIDIFNNVVHQGLYGGIQVTKWQDTKGIAEAIGMRRRIRIFNNTVVGVGSGGVGGGIHLQCDDPDHVDDVEIINNIVSGNYSGQIIIPENVQNKAYLSNNLIDGQGGIVFDSSLCIDCLQGDPGFVNIGENPFDLKQNSIAKDAAKPVTVDVDFSKTSTILDFDYLGRSRSNTSMQDVGAYELQSN